MSRLSVNDWLLAETFRHLEERSGRLADQAAVVVARDRGGDLAQRIRARAAALSSAPAVRADILRLRRALVWLGVGMAGLGALAGAVAARTTVAESRVDILLAAAALLLVPSLMLLLWAVLMAWGRGRAGPPSLAGSVVGRILRRLAPRLLASPHAADVMAAFASLLSAGWGRWVLSVIGHGFWLGYALGAFGALVVFFSVVQYELIWGTTLLSDHSVVQLVQGLAAWPEILGFMPEADEAWIVAGREGAAEATARAEWARFLLAMIAAWAIVPRAFLFGASLGLAALSGRRVHLDTTHPGYLRLAGDLAVVARHEPAASPPLPPRKARGPRRQKSGARGILAVAVELEREGATGAGVVPGIEVIDLGRADDRAGRRAALEAAAGLRRPAAAVLGICSMLRTPDVGTGDFLSRLADTADAPLWLVLDENARLQARGGDSAARRRDWQALAERAGASVVMIDHEAPEAGELAQLHRALAVGGDAS